MTPRPDVSEARKNQILDAALQVFARRGFHKARMDDIAQEAGLSKGALYWYFRSKDALIESLVDKLFTWEIRNLERLASSHDRPVPDRLRELSRNVLKSLDRWKPVLPVLYEFYALATRPGPVRNALQGYYRRYLATLTKLIAEGVARGELRAVDPDMTAMTLIVQFEGLMLLWVIDPETFNFPTQWLPMSEYFIASIEA
ncbi:MAG: TetR/AcrR family transcriptional regulator [Chloroflexi bacterium]|nr:TetR/AcrR family transcriptional regulator [Chloroflexota bacterium]